MKKLLLFCLITLSSITTSKVFASDLKLSFDEYVKYCITKPNIEFIEQCNNAGISYELLDTTLLTSQNELISFTTAKVYTGINAYRENHFNFQMVCELCSGNNSLIASFEAYSRFKDAFKISSKNNKFRSKIILKNKVLTDLPEKLNNGSIFNDGFKEYAEGNNTFESAFQSIFNNQNIVLIKDDKAKLFSLFEVTEGNFKFVSDLTNIQKNEDGSNYFTAYLDINNTQPFVDTIYGNSLNLGKDCTVELLNSKQILKAQVMCND